MSNAFFALRLWKIWSQTNQQTQNIIWTAVVTIVYSDKLASGISCPDQPHTAASKVKSLIQLTEDAISIPVPDPSKGSIRKKGRKGVSCWVYNPEKRGILCRDNNFPLSVQSLSSIQLFVTPWTAACQASLSPTPRVYSNSCPSPRWCHPTISSSVSRPLLLLPSIFPSIRVFSNESAFRIRWPKYWSFSFNISPSNEH